jgi:hypothetical protein
VRSCSKIAHQKEKGRKGKEKKKAAPPFLIAKVAITVLLAILVGVGDLCQANAYRSFAEHGILTHSRGTETLYYGGDWGWNDYMNKAGFKAVVST